MYGWIDLIDVVQEEQLSKLSFIGQMLKSSDIESKKLAISLLLTPDFDNIRTASVDCGAIRIHYNIKTRSYIVHREYHVVHHQIYTIGYIMNTIKDFIDHEETSPDDLYYWNEYNLKASVILDLISVLTLAINRTCEFGQSFI